MEKREILNDDEEKVFRDENEKKNLASKSFSDLRKKKLKCLK